MIRNFLKKKYEGKKEFVDRKTLLASKKASKSKSKKTSKPLSQREMNFKKAFQKRILWAVLSTVSILILIGGVFVWYRYYDFSSKFNSRISALDPSGSCKSYSSRSITSFLLFNLDDKENIKSVYINIFSPEHKYSYDISKSQFDIDNGGNVGSIVDYVKINNLFVNKETLFRYIASLLSRQFYLKIDYVVLTKGNIEVKDLSTFNNKFYSYIFNSSSVPFDRFQMTSDLCQDDLKKLIEQFYSTDARIQERSGLDIRVSNLFELSTIKKEQLKIYINNKTGITSIGDYYRDYFTGYGLNIVKVDNAVIPVEKTRITVDADSVKSSNTMTMISYLMEKGDADIVVDTQTNVFSNIYIELGEDSLIN